MALCQLVGHSYDWDVMDGWERLEGIFQRVSSCPDVAAMTNLEIVRYKQAMDAATILDDHIRNNSNEDIWFRVNGETICIHPGETYMRKD